MPLPRRLLVDDARRGAFHLISRCVRRAYLCGDAAEHRRAWVRDLLRQAAGAFAVDVLAYAVMSNHVHIVVRTDPDRVNGWSATEVAARYPSDHPYFFCCDRSMMPGCPLVSSRSWSVHPVAVGDRAGAR